MIRVWSQNTYRHNTREVVISDQREDGREFVMQPPVWVEVDPNIFIEPDRYTFPGISAGRGLEFLQAILDHAWQIGMRPAGFAGMTLNHEALKDHLADMRALVFNKALAVELDYRDLPIGGTKK